MGSSPAAGGTQAVDRAAALIDLVVRADDPPSFTELSDETGLARSTTSRLLAALGQRAAKVGSPVLGSGRLPKFVAPW